MIAKENCLAVLSLSHHMLRDLGMQLQWFQFQLLVSLLHHLPVTQKRNSWLVYYPLLTSRPPFLKKDYSYIRFKLNDYSSRNIKSVLLLFYANKLPLTEKKWYCFWLRWPFRVLFSARSSRSVSSISSALSRFQLNLNKWHDMNFILCSYVVFVLEL